MTGARRATTTATARKLSAMPTLTQWIDRVEALTGDEDALHSAMDDAARDDDLTTLERGKVVGRCERYVEVFDDARQGSLLSAVDDALDRGDVNDPSIPDFDLSYPEPPRAALQESDDPLQPWWRPRADDGRWRSVGAAQGKLDLTTAAGLSSVYDGFSYGGVTVSVLGSSETDSGVGVYGYLSHDPGDGGDPLNVGSFETSVTYGEDGSPYLYRDLVELQPEFQGRGFATAFYAHEEAQALASGIDRIELSASLETGGYSWARAGFEFQDAHERIDRLRSAAHVWDLYGEHDVPIDDRDVPRQAALRAIRERVGDERWAAFVNRFPKLNDDEDVTVSEAHPQAFEYPHEIAMAGKDDPHWDQDGHDVWLGKAFMLGAGWEGVKYLRPPIQEADYESPCAVVQAVHDRWVALGKMFDPPDSNPVDEDAFWTEVERALGDSAKLQEAVAWGAREELLHPRQRVTKRWVNKPGGVFLPEAKGVTPEQAHAAVGTTPSGPTEGQIALEDRAWVAPPPPVGKAGGSAGGKGYSSDTAYGTNTALGHVGEAAFEKLLRELDLGFEPEILHPEGKGAQSPLDVRWDGLGFEVKAVSTKTLGYKATPKPHEIASKEAAAQELGVKASLAIIVIDSENGQAHAYYRDGLKGGRLSSNTGWKYLGSTALEDAAQVEKAHTSPKIQ